MGHITYSHATSKLDLDAQNRIPKTDALCRIASMSKPVKSVAVVQQVERDTVKLNDGVHDPVPELKDVRILEGFEAQCLPHHQMATVHKIRK